MLPTVSASQTLPTPATSLYRQFDKVAQPESDFDKSIPYFPAKYDHSVAENQKHQFANKSKIVCRHLAIQWLIDRLLGGKVDYGLFQADKITGHVHPEAEKIYRAALKEADIAVVDNAIVGQHLADIFLKMESMGKTAAGCLLEGADHSMAVALQIKTGSDGIKKYVLTFYDANQTATHVRIAQKEVLNPFGLAQLGTRDLLGQEKDDYYFGPSNTSCLAVFDAEQLTDIIGRVESGAPPVAGPAATKSAVIDFNPDTINPTHIFHLLSQGCDQTLRELKPYFDYLRTDNPQKLIRLAVAAGTNKDFGLCYALYMGHARAIDAFKDMLTSIQPDKRAAVLIKASQNGLALAMQSGHADAVAAYGELIEAASLSSKDRLEVLMATSQEGITLAMQNGHAPAVAAYAKLLQKLAPSQQVALLGKIASEGPALALRNGHIEPLQLYEQILASVPPAQRMELLIPDAGEQRETLIESLRDARTVQIKAFLQTLLNLSLSGTPGALTEYVKMLDEVIPIGDRHNLKENPNNRHLQFLFGGKHNEALMVSVFHSASAQDKKALLALWDQFGVAEDFVLAISTSGDVGPADIMIDEPDLSSHKE